MKTIAAFNTTPRASTGIKSIVPYAGGGPNQWRVTLAEPCAAYAVFLTARVINPSESAGASMWCRFSDTEFVINGGGGGGVASISGIVCDLSEGD